MQKKNAVNAPQIVESQNTSNPPCPRDKSRQRSRSGCLSGHIAPPD